MPAVLAAIALTVTFTGCGTDAVRPSPTDTPPAPADFFGLVSEDAFAAPPAERRSILRRQAQAGIRLLRQTFDWSLIERTRGRFDLAQYDEYVADAAAAGMTLLPILFNPPPFHSRGGERKPGEPAHPPDRIETMQVFARALVQRYGPGGSLWRDRPGLPARPVRSWQIWNEPNLPDYWGGTPSAAEYGLMLRRVGRAIRDEDRAAEIVTAGLPDSRLGIGFEAYLDALIRGGGRAAFDTVAIHPYARTAAGVVLAVRRARRIVTRLGHPDAKIWVTEFGWASDGPPSPFTLGEDGQARELGRALRDLRRLWAELGLRGVVYFNWRDAPPYAGGRDFWGLHTGLLDIAGRPKPALRALEREVRPHTPTG